MVDELEAEKELRMHVEEMATMHGYAEVQYAIARKSRGNFWWEDFPSELLQSQRCSGIIQWRVGVQSTGLNVR